MKENTTSGTSIDFTIPSGVKRITVEFGSIALPKEKWWAKILNFFGMHRFDICHIKLTDSGGIETSSYLATDHNCSISTDGKNPIDLGDELLTIPLSEALEFPPHEDIKVKHD